MMKLKALLFTTFTLMPLSIWAEGNVFLRTSSEAVKSDISKTCREQGVRLGDGKTLGYIQDPCLDEVVNSAPLSNRDTHDEAQIKAFALGNVIYYEVTKKDIVYPKMLAGDQTKLKKIDQLRLHPESQEIFVLDREQGMISAHASKYSGNVAPLKFFEDERLKDAQSFTFSSDLSRIYVYSLKEKTFLDYPVDLSDQSRSPASLEKKAQLKIENSQELKEFNDLWAHEDKIYALDAKSSKLVVLEKTKKGSFEVIQSIALARFSADAPFTRMKGDFEKNKKNLVFFDEYSRELEITLPED